MSVGENEGKDEEQYLQDTQFDTVAALPAGPRHTAFGQPEHWHLVQVAPHSRTCWHLPILGEVPIGNAHDQVCDIELLGPTDDLAKRRHPSVS